MQSGSAPDQLNEQYWPQQGSQLHTLLRHFGLHKQPHSPHSFSNSKAIRRLQQGGSASGASGGGSCGASSSTSSISPTSGAVAGSGSGNGSLGITSAAPPTTTCLTPSISQEGLLMAALTGAVADLALNASRAQVGWGGGPASCPTYLPLLPYSVPLMTVALH